jgi:hypothetical protein
MYLTKCFLENLFNLLREHGSSVLVEFKPITFSCNINNNKNRLIGVLISTLKIKLNGRNLEGSERDLSYYLYVPTI